MSAKTDDAAEREAYVRGARDVLAEAERRFKDNTHMASTEVRHLLTEIERGIWPPKEER